MAKKREDELPRTLATLWRHADRQQKSTPRRLTLERIVAAAIDIAEEDGLMALSMVRLAERLDCAPMSLYRHVANRSELEALMIDIAPGAPPEIHADLDWREGITRWACALRTVYLRHPWILQVAVSGPPREPGQLAWLERGLRALAHTNLPPHDQMGVIMLVLHYVRGEAQLSKTLSSGRNRPKTSDHDEWFVYSRTLSKLIDAARFPALVALIESDVDDRGRERAGDLTDFDFGLERILDGVSALIDSRPSVHVAKTGTKKVRRRRR